MSDADLEEFLTTDHNYEYDDVSLKSGCEDTLEAIGPVLGKKYML